MHYDTLILYTLVSFFYIISPGPAVFLAINNGMSAGVKAVVLSSLGNIMGLLFLSTLSIVGLASVILASASLFMLVKLVGAGYLIYLGVKQFRSSKQIQNKDFSASMPRSVQAYFTEGFLLAATNPKPILFFIAIFPQFLDANMAIASQFMMMTSIFMALSFLSLFSYGYVGQSAKRFFSSPIRMQWFHRITGGLFIGLGLALLQLKNTQNQLPS